FALGSQYRHDAAFDYQKMTSWFRQAEDAYRTAVDLGSSDPTVYEAECELFAQWMNAASQGGDSMRPGFENAISACQKAIIANPKGGAGYVKLAAVHNFFAWWLATGEHGEQRLDDALEEAARHAEEAAKKSPDDPMAVYLVGATWRTRALYMG